MLNEQLSDQVWTRFINNYGFANHWRLDARLKYAARRSFPCKAFEDWLHRYGAYIKTVGGVRHIAFYDEDQEFFFIMTEL